MQSYEHQGAVAEQAIVLAAVKLGVPVLKPVAEHGRSDLALDIGGKLWRVQCKWGRLSPDRDVVIAHLHTSRRVAGGYVRTTYTAEEVDLFGVYSGDLDRCFLLPQSEFDGMSAVQLRLTPPRNSQRACVNLADDFDFEGAVAQLVERVAGSHEVRGSSPLSSTPPQDRIRFCSVRTGFATISAIGWTASQRASTYSSRAAASRGSDSARPPASRRK